MSRFVPKFVPALLRQPFSGTVARYTAASVVALAADAGTFLILLQSGVSAASAAALGFTLGIGVNWVVSSRVLFTAAMAEPGLERWRQRALFLFTALVGLALTTVIVGGGTRLMIDPRLAKLVAIGVSFATTSGLRHVLVFSTAKFGSQGR